MDAAKATRPKNPHAALEYLARILKDDPANQEAINLANEIGKEIAADADAKVRHFEEGKKYVATVGSVGQPRDNDNRACCCVYDDEARTLEYFRVEYDIRSSARKIFESDLSSDFAKRLFFGI